MGSVREIEASQQEKQLRRCGCCPWWFCPVFACIAGIIFLLVGIWSVHLKSRFTPIYQTIKCSVGQPILDKFEGLKISLTIEVQCDNPNPYTLTVSSVKQGKIYMGSDRSEVGFTQMPSGTLPAEGTGKFMTLADIDLSAHLLGELITALVGDVALYMDLDLDVNVDVNFLLGSFQQQLPFHKDCGMYLVGVPSLLANSNAAKFGPMACAAKGQTVSIPAADSESSDGLLPLTAPNMDKQRIAEAKELKDTSLTASMAISFSLCALCLTAALGCLMCQMCRRRSAADASQEDCLPPTAVKIGRGENVEEV